MSTGLISVMARVLKGTWVSHTPISLTRTSTMLGYHTNIIDSLPNLNSPNEPQTPVVALELCNFSEDNILSINKYHPGLIGHDMLKKISFPHVKYLSVNKSCDLKSIIKIVESNMCPELSIVEYSFPNGYDPLHFTYKHTKEVLDKKGIFLITHTG